MNRETEEFRISSDIKQANLEVLQVRLEQAEHCIREVAASLAWNCFGECRAVHDGPIMPAQGALEMARDFLASQKGERNQCDGCQAGIPLVDGAHRMGRQGGYPDLMSCQKERYEHPEQAEGAQGEREEAERKCQFLAGFHRVSVEQFKRDLAPAFAALAQPSPAPELERPEPVAWALQRKSDGFVRATWNQKPSETQYEIAELDGDVIVPLYAAPVAQAGQVQDWVACAERLPESGEPVNVWCSGSNQAGVAWIRQGAWLMPEPQALGYESITHWAPLSAAPAQGGSTDE